jgi:hypothetical protein
MIDVLHPRPGVLRHSPGELNFGILAKPLAATITGHGYKDSTPVATMDQQIIQPLSRCCLAKCLVSKGLEELQIRCSGFSE